MLDQARAAGKPITPAMEKWAKWMDDMEAETLGGDGPMLKPGDASMASPFTAKATGVMPCTDIIKQGRCTLVTTVQAREGNVTTLVEYCSRCPPLVIIELPPPPWSTPLPRRS
jgi:hypothetical protein